MPIHIEHVEAALGQLLPRKDAAEQARAVAEDMEAIELPLVVGPPSHQQLGRPAASWCYHVSGAAFGPEKLAEICPGTHKAGGFGLDLGNIYQLAEVCQIGRRLLGPRWSTRFKRQLRDGGEHLAIVEAIWWLGRWHAVTRVEANVHPFKGNHCDVDWRFRCGAALDGLGPIINLEVKLRPSVPSRLS